MQALRSVLVSADLWASVCGDWADMLAHRICPSPQTQSKTHSVSMIIGNPPPQEKIERIETIELIELIGNSFN